MDSKLLRKRLVIRAAIVVLSVGASYGIYAFSDYRIAVTKEKQQWLQNDISALTNKLSTLNKKSRQFAESATIWESFPEDAKQAQGLRISEGQAAFDAFKARFLMSQLEVTFTKSTTLGDVYKTGNASAVSSDVTIRYAGLTDTLVFAFLSALKEEFPGYIQVRSLNMLRAGSITKQALKEVAENNPPGLVTGDLQLVWRDIKYTPDKKDEAKPGEAAPSSPSSPSAH